MSTTFKSKVTWSFVGNVVYSASQWGMLILLAKFTSAEVVGRFALGLSIVSPVFSFTNLNLRAVQATDVIDQHLFQEYRNFRVLMSTLALLIVVSVLLVVDMGMEVNVVVCLLAFAKYAESMSDVCYGLYQRHEMMRAISQSLMIRGPLGLAILAGLLLFVGNAIAAALAMLLASLVVFLFYDRRLVKSISQSKDARPVPAWNWHLYRGLFVMALPLGITILLNTLNMNIPRYVIADELGEKSLGIYVSIAYLLVAGSTVINAVGQSATPRLARYFRSDINAYYRLIKKLLIIAFSIGLLGLLVSVVVGEPVLTIIYSKEYAQYDDLLAWIMMGAIVLYVSAMLGCSITAARSFTSQSIFAAVVSVTMIIAQLFLVPKYGLVGAACAVAVAYTVKLLGQSIQLAYLINRNRVF